MLPSSIGEFYLFAFLMYLVALPTSADDPPRIEMSPRDQTVISGSVASFICTAFGNPKPVIEWRKDNRRITTQRYAVHDMPNGSVLRIEPVRPERDNSIYECVAENGVGEPVKAAAELRVLSEDDIPVGFPQFTMQPTMQGVEKGRTTNLYCQAEGNPSPSVYWLKDMVPVNLADPRLSIVQGTYLQISEAKEEDQGTYQCVAENSMGSAFSNLASLYVKVRRVPPYFSIPPEPVYEVMPGSSLNLTCVAVGSPMPYVKWRKGTVDLTPDHSLPVGKNVLQLKNIRKSANYTCVAASKLGNIETVTGVLVQALPRPPTNLRISDVTARSIRLSWSYDIGAENIKYYIIHYKPKQANQEYSELSGIVTTFYTVSDLLPYTEYEFYVIAANVIGRGSPSTPAMVTTGETMEPPGTSKPGSAPRNVQARPLSSSTVVIQWDPPKEPNGQVTGYKVYFTTQPNLPTTNWDTQNVDSSTLTTVSDMTPQTIYTIRVQAFTSRGPGPLSAPVQVKTQQGVPSQPSNLVAKSTSSTTVQLQWSHPEHSGESIIGYELYWNDTFTQQEYHRTIPAINSYTLSNLYPDTLYHIWVAAKSKRGEGAATPPVNVKTDQYLPGAPPQHIHGSAVSSRSLRITWLPPPVDQQNGQITYYKIKYLKASTSNDPKKARQIQTGPDERSFIIDGLEKWTKYYIWVLAGTVVGDGPLSAPLIVQTDEDVPGEPRNVKVDPVNSTSLQVQWKPPANKDRNGLIRGYQIHIQEKDKNNNFVGEPIRYDVANEEAESYNVTGLQPDTTYTVQVAAVTRKGDGTRSHPKIAKTRGGVPSKPELNVRVVSESPQLKVEVSWAPPKYIYGDLLGYRLRYRRKDDLHTEEKVINLHDQNTIIDSLARGAKYEFRLAGRNSLGLGQEASVPLETPEGVPTAPPQNITHYLQSPTTLVIRWSPPLSQYSNGRIIQYGILFHKASQDASEKKNVTTTRCVFSSLDENTKYVFRVQAYTSVGPGPWSSHLVVDTQGDGPSAPTNVQAMATSDQSLEVWWDEVPYFPDILGYQVLYTQTAVADLDLWRRKKVPLTWSAELTALDSHATYSIRVAAYTKPERLGHLSEVITVTIVPTDVPAQLRAHGVTTHSMILSWRHPQKLNPIKYKISFGAHKEFHDSQRVLQTLTIPVQTILIEPNITEYKIDDLMPFTTYQVNITAIPPEESYRPPAKISVTTARAAPKPMVKPDTVGVQNQQEIILILPQASEEFGLISHYFLVVVPADKAREDPDTYIIEELNDTYPDKLAPYVAAKFLPRDMPEKFHLGDGKVYNGYLNKPLQHNQKYRIFMRAVVDTPQKNLYTSSPMSDTLSLDLILSGQPALSGASGGDMANKVDSSIEDSDVVWVVIPIIVCLIFVLCIAVFIIIKRRRQLSKASVGETANKLLVNSADREFTTHPTDPVELRRLNYQTPAMINHPPIPVTELANHIERLKANDNQKFSQEYESVEPGQQFTWENSNLEVNKPKNRYANVIAYDHSRVVLQTIDGISGTDYINANYCDGYRKQNAYIATQGPLSETVGDFWRMVWEQRSATIVMMTKLEERTRIKCDQYWPLRGTEKYGVMNISLADIQELATYCIRTFIIQKMGYPEKREVRQFQFTAWPDHGVPEHPTPFLTFLQRIRALNPPEAGPVVVHCSAGVGRTGCYIVIDSMLERLRYENTVDIYGHVTCLRAQRNYMVQTEDQYIFIHDAVLDAVLSGNTEVPAQNLYSHIQELMEIVPGENCSGMELEFKRLSTVRSQPNRFVSANLPINKFKNRLMNILPYEATRVCLQPIRGVDGSDYINASFIDGYKYRNAYIATQGPLPETTEDFWRMLWEHNSNIIVILTKLKEVGRERCHQYWPSEKSQRYLYFVVDPITEYNMPQYILREFKVTDARDGQSRTIRQFHFTEWPEQGVPKSGEGFIDFIGQVHKTKEQFGQEGPITVHCSAGVGRTGVFISLSIVLERMQDEGVVDIFQTVRTLRTQRPGMVQTEDQYRFCYSAALEYLGSFDHYTN
ncbi:tyrosine-protein phosphatase Lar-like isoform X3 [Limulus polyphemus]|uniref:protein-tyrosine-phosphatase n=1 Tax=Limulus polyphemus TaxID=6850 RepID=A0ABM1SWD1_LIMPO|nr:tyrosine-protein phosphatase Lar-like isoform X3 [Limulus polyphemus]